MITESDKWNAFKEACTDTFLASLLNVPLNFLMVSVAYHYEMTAIQTTIFMTTVFTIIAISRKTYVRLHFLKRYRKKKLETQELPK